MSQTEKKNRPAVSVSENAVKKTKNKKRMPKVFKLYLCILVIAVIVGLTIAAIKYFGKDAVKRSASLSIEFTYDGAAQNKTPSGDQFSINGITNENVLSEALQVAGFSEKYSTDDLRSSLVISGVYPSDVISRIKQYDSLYDFSESRMVSLDDYYPTMYSVVLYDNFDSSVSDSDLKKIVESIASVYKSYFINKYSFAYDMSDYSNLLVIGKYDYAQVIKVLKTRLELVRRYAGELFTEDSAFRKDGISFNDIKIRSEHIENETLSRTEATIMSDVLTISAARLRNQYEYEIKMLENEKIYKSKNLEEINALIDSYEMDGILYIPAGESVVKVDSNSKETYETLIDTKREISERLVTIDSEIERYNSYLEDLKKSSSEDDSKNDAVKNKLTEIESTVSELENSFKELVEAYNASIIDESSVILDNSKYSGAKLLSGGFIVMAVKCTAPFCIIVLIVFGINMFIIENRKFRAEQKLNS